MFLNYAIVLPKLISFCSELSCPWPLPNELVIGSQSLVVYKTLCNCFIHYFVKFHEYLFHRKICCIFFNSMSELHFPV